MLGNSHIGNTSSQFQYCINRRAKFQICKFTSWKFPKSKCPRLCARVRTLPDLQISKFRSRNFDLEISKVPSSDLELSKSNVVPFRRWWAQINATHTRARSGLNWRATRLWPKTCGQKLVANRLWPNGCSQKALVKRLSPKGRGQKAVAKRQCPRVTSGIRCTFDFTLTFL